jgi:thioredoxin 1
MHHNGFRFITTMTAALIGVASTVWAQSKTDKPQGNDDAKALTPLVTFVELGSVKCIPCRQMQPVMKAVEEKYGKQVNVVFYDVWKDDQRGYAEKYGIKVIPTQVFLDKEGKEFFRHEGFFPEAEIDKLLQKRGLNARSGG